MSLAPRPVLLAGLASLVVGCSSAPTEPPPEPEPVDPPPGIDLQSDPHEALQDGTVPIPVATTRTDSGITVLVMPPQSDTIEPVAEICLCLPAGRGHGRAGLVELAIESLVSSPPDEGGDPSPRSVLRGLGGSLETVTGRDRSWVYLRVPPAHWQAALETLARSLAEPATARTAIAGLRSKALAERARDFRGERAHVALAGGLMRDAGGPAETLADLEDCDPAEIVLFQRRHFRPRGSLLAVSVPDATPDQVSAKTLEGLADWNARAAAPGPPAGQEPLAAAIHWVPGEGPCRTALLLGLPDPLHEHAAGQWILQECLTMEGVGGRLERALIDAGAAQNFGAEITSSGTRDWLVLTAEVEPGRVPLLWRVVEAARASLGAVGPSESERSLATRRARLSLLTQRRTPLRRLQLAIRRTTEGLADPLGTHLERLADPDHDLDDARASWLRLPFAMVVVGGEPPDAEEIVRHDPVGESAADPVEEDLSAQIEDARPWLDRALEAMGGAHKVGAVRGYRQVAELRLAGSPAAAERVALDGAELVRERDVLGTTVRTVVEDGEGTESAGDATRELEPVRVAELMLEANRHPLMLLASAARGRLRFRLVSVRRLGDRDVAVLEAVRSPYARLRIHVDTQSGLPRVVESWADDTEGPLHVRENWSDFRDSGGIRVPFHRVTDVDDGNDRLETVVSEFEPIRR